MPSSPGESHYRALVDSAPIGIFEANEQGEYTYVNAAGCDMVGYTKAELLDLSVTDLEANGDSLAEVSRFADRKQGDHGRTEMELRHKDGSTVAVRLDAVQIDDKVVAYVQEITERKEFERELRELKDRYQQFVDHSTDIITVTDRDGTITFESQAVEEVLGYDPATRLDEDLLSFVHPADRSKAAEQIQAVKDQNQQDGARTELRFQTQDGDYRWLESIGIDQTDSEIGGLVFYARDVTERKRREQELRDLRERFELAIEGANIGIWDWDMRTDEVTRDELLAGMLGYSPQEMGSRLEDWEELTHPDGRRRHDEALADHIENDTSHYASEYRMQTASGDWKWVQTIGKVVEYDDEEPVRAVGIHLDINDRKQRERKLRELKERYETFVEYASDIVSVVDETGTVTYQNPAVERILGVDPEARIGESVIKYVHPDDREAVTDRFESVVNGDADPSTRVEFRYEDPDGSYRWLESIAVDRTETPIGGYVIYSRDISDQKEREQRLRREKNRLDDFASMVSHDLRNPLNVAQGRIDLAQQSSDSEHLDAAADGVDRALELIEQMLELARTGDTVSYTKPLELPEVVDDSWETVTTADAEVGIDATATVWADRSRLQQLLENLFRNAIEHGGNDVTVTVGPLQNGFYVEDDGPGIPEADREDVFEPGQSSDPDGTGFGLSIVKQIVEAHEWSIQIAEGSEGGARFEITDVEVTD